MSRDQGQDPASNPYWQQKKRQRSSKKGQKIKGNLHSALGAGDTPASQAPSEQRLAFIRKTYAWLTGAIFLCIGMMAAFWHSPFFEPVITQMHRLPWLVVLGVFIGASWVGDYMAHRVESKGLQMIGMMVGVGAYAVIFSYLFVMTGTFTPDHGVDPATLWQAAGLTLLVFSVLTGLVFITKKDFSVLRTGLIVMSVLAFGAIIAGSLFGFTLGLGFAVAMVGFSSALIVYQTSNILHHYPTDRHAGAALALFSSIGMLFWYLFMILGMDG